MKTQIKLLRAAIVSGLFGAMTGIPMTLIAAPCMPCAPRTGKRNPCSPCAARNPCGARNPCAVMNPCAASGRIDPKQVTRPKGTKPYKGDRQALQNEGKVLWNDPKLSSSGNLSCATCHQDGTAMLQPSFAKPYPHFVQMAADSASMKSITLEEMVQLCMVKPMQATPLVWDSRQLAALTAYMAKLQKSFKPVAGAHNPCAAKNPCAARNPCSAGGTCAAKRH